MSISPPLRWAALAAAQIGLFASPSWAGDILVDPRGTGDVPTIEDGLSIASPGDVLILYPGVYAEAVLITKSVWLVPQQPGTVTLDGLLSIRDLPAGEHVVLVDMNVHGDPDGCLIVEDCDGVVHLDDCHLKSKFEFVPSAFLNRSRRVIFTDTDLRGTGDDDPVLNLPGCCPSVALEMRDSRATIWGGEILGGAGGDAQFSCDFSESQGADAVDLFGSQLFVSGVTIRGGNGGNANCSFAPYGAAGGDGIQSDSGSKVFLQDVVLEGGEGGPQVQGSGNLGPMGLSFRGSGLARFFGGAAQTRSSGRFAFNQGTLNLEVAGNPGERVRAFLLVGTPPFLFDAFPGSGPVGIGQVFATNSAVGEIGTIPASGLLQANINIPALPTESVPVTFLAVSASRHGRALFGAPMPVLGVHCGTVGPDCDGDGIVDLCAFAQGLSTDVDGNGQVDGCTIDCNGNGVADDLDISNGTSLDENFNGRPDECDPPAQTWSVAPGAAPGGDGSAMSPFSTIEEAALAARSGDTIRLEDGLYTGPGNRNVNFGFRSLKIESVGGAAQCILDLEHAGRAFRFNGSAGYGRATISGVTFRNGVVASGQAGPNQSGGALYVESMDLEIVACSFESNVAIGGGAVSVASGGLDVRDSLFSENSNSFGNGGGRGGAILAVGMSAPMIVEGCRFVRNGGRGSGGAIHAATGDASVAIVRCEFLGNSLTPPFTFGGAVFISGVGGVTIDQCLFAGNVARVGGALSLDAGASDFIGNSTFVSNSSAFGGACALTGAGSVELSNSILWDNTAGAVGSGVLIQGSAVLEVRSCNLEGGLSAIVANSGPLLGTIEDWIDAHPLFANPAGPDGDPLTFHDNNYRLLGGSPSVDAGNNARIAVDAVDVDSDGDAQEPAPWDLDGAPRRTDDLGTPDTGLGAAPVVDHGAYER